MACNLLAQHLSQHLAQKHPKVNSRTCSFNGTVALLISPPARLIPCAEYRRKGLPSKDLAAVGGEKALKTLQDRQSQC